LVFIPYFFEFFLKLRGLMQKESFAKPNPDNSLNLRYEKIYGLEHAAHRLLLKIKNKVYEKNIVYSIYAIEIIIALIVVLLQ